MASQAPGDRACACVCSRSNPWGCSHSISVVQVHIEPASAAAMRVARRGAAWWRRAAASSPRMYRA